MKKIIKNAPVLLLLISTGIFLTMIGIGGKNNIYIGQEHNFLTKPLLALVFQGMNEEKYPWQILGWQAAGGKELQALSASVEAEFNEAQPDIEPVLPLATATPFVKPQSTVQPTMEPTAAPTAEPESRWQWEEGAERGYMDENGEIQPYRESTHEEYLNHISADIYGSIGVERAGEYEFTTVGEDYFDDALFIGDSRMVGLRDYTDLPEHADFMCETSLTIYKIFEQNIGKKGTVEEVLSQNDYGKIYLSVGINELGRGTTEDFIAQYKETVSKLRQLEPEAMIIIQGIMKVSKTKNDADAIFNNHNIQARNHAMATLADNQSIYYIDANEVVCDEAGNLQESYTFDEIHLLGVYNEVVKQFLLDHGVVNSNTMDNNDMNNNTMHNIE